VIAVDVARRCRLFVYPRLREVPVTARDETLRAARRTALDLLERIGVLAGLACTAAIVQGVGADWSSPPARFTAQFAAALPLLCVLAGPFLLRRTRRGLDVALLQRSHPQQIRSGSSHADQ
jgi:hypothetical protein